jgi:hypothetical protein
VQSRPVSCDARTEESFAQIDSWISECSLNHSNCCPRVPLCLPTRVIDVGDSSRSPSLFTSLGQHGTWVALSYCWGNLLPLRTMTHTLEDFHRQIPFKMLPALFQDVVTLVRRLGHRYLWIDALCIIQDSETDWLSESIKMGEIFQGATLTIAAEAARDSSVGLSSSMRKKGPPSIVISAYSQLRGIRGHVSEGIEPFSKQGVRTPQHKHATHFHCL